MGITQALSAALAGVNMTQQGLSVIAGNVANANTPGYVDESVNQVEVGTGGQRRRPASIRPASTAISIRCCKANCGPRPPAAPMPTPSAQLYQQLQQVYGTPGSSTSFDAIYNNFTTALQSLSTSPGSYSAQAAVVERGAGAWRKISMR